MRSPFGIDGISHAAGVVLSVVGSARALAAQVIREPVLLFEPGVVTINAASAPLPTGSSTGLNLRFLAVFPTSIPWLSADIAGARRLSSR